MVLTLELPSDSQGEKLFAGISFPSLLTAGEDGGPVRPAVLGGRPPALRSALRSVRPLPDGSERAGNALPEPALSALVGQGGNSICELPRDACAVMGHMTSPGQLARPME